jgi:hypothetical protein
VITGTSIRYPAVENALNSLNGISISIPDFREYYLLMITVLALIIFCMTTGPVDREPVVEVRSCPGRMNGPICQDYWGSDTIFTGTVTKLVVVPYPEPTPEYHWQRYQKVTATVAVDEVFRGKVGREVVFEMGDCYFEFEEGRKYIIYPAKNSDGKFVLGRHSSRTRLIEDATEDLDYIRGLADAPAGGRIFGEVWDHRERPTLRLGDAPSPDGTKIAGVKIFLHQGDKRYETVSDAAGSYEFTDLPVGKYELTTNLPEHLTGHSHSITITGNGCVPAPLSVQASGEIKGRLVDVGGQPIKDAIVSIFAADGVVAEMFDMVRTHSMNRAETDKEGTFRFVRLPAGSYHLAVNLVEAEL